MAETDALPEAERGFVARLLAQAPGPADAIAAAKRLNLLLRHQSEEGSGEVLEDAAATQLAEFAAILQRDLTAVQAALDTPWTTSPAESQITRTKTSKRSMYGRAGFQLGQPDPRHPARLSTTWAFSGQEMAGTGACSMGKGRAGRVGRTACR